MKKLLLLCCAALMIVALAADYDDYDEQTATVFSYAEALALTIEGLPVIQDLENAIEDLEEQLDDLRTMYREIRWFLSSTVLDRFRRQMTEVERQIQHFRLDIETAKAQAELSLRRAILDIANAAMDIDAAEASLLISTEHLRHVSLRHEFGLASANDLRLAEQRLEQELIRLENLRLTQSNAQGRLNHLLGQPPYQETVVEFERVLPEIPDNLQHHISTIAPNTPASRQIHINVLRRRDDITQHVDQCRYTSRRNCETYIALRTAHERVRLDHAIAIRQTETALRTAYSSLEQLFNREAAALVNLDQAVTRLETAHTNFELGRVTRLDVDRAYFDVLSAAMDVERVLYEQWLLGLLLRYPGLL